MGFLIISWADGDPPVLSCFGYWSGSVVGELYPATSTFKIYPVGILALSKNPSHWPWCHSGWACPKFHSPSCARSTPCWNPYKFPFHSFTVGGWLCGNHFLPASSVKVSPLKEAVGPRAHSQGESRLLKGSSLEAPEERSGAADTEECGLDPGGSCQLYLRQMKADWRRGPKKPSPTHILDVTPASILEDSSWRGSRNDCY